MSDAARVFVIDDEPMAVGLHRRQFEKAGAMVDAFSAGPPALAAAALERPDVICCDLRMPGLDGFRFLRALAALNPLPAVAFVSGAEAPLLRVVERLGRSLGLTVIGAFPKPLGAATAKEILQAGLNATPARPVAKPAHLASEEVAEAIGARRFIPYFQPKIHSLTGDLAGFEVLARLELANGRVVAPAEFVPQTIAAGAIDIMTETLAHEAFAFAAGFGVSTAINVTARQFSRLDLPDRVVDMARTAGLPGRRVTIEVTETEAVENRAAMQEVLGRLALQDIRVSLDDFGAGFSNLSRVAGMPIAELKIDGDIVRSARIDPACRAVLDVSITLAKRPGVTLVAEGVETFDEQDLFEPADNLVFQGFFFGGPMPAENAARWARADAAARKERDDPAVVASAAS